MTRGGRKSGAAVRTVSRPLTLLQTANHLRDESGYCQESAQ